MLSDVVADHELATAARTTDHSFPASMSSMEHGRDKDKEKEKLPRPTSAESEKKTRLTTRLFTSLTKKRK